MWLWTSTFYNMLDGELIHGTRISIYKTQNGNIVQIRTYVVAKQEDGLWDCISERLATEAHALMWADLSFIQNT